MILYTPVTIGVNNLHYVVEEGVGIFEGCQLMSEVNTLREAVSLTVVHLPQALLEAIEIQLTLLPGIQCTP